MKIPALVSLVAVVVSLLVAPLAMREPATAPVVRNDRPGEAIAFRALSLRDENGRVPADGLIRAKRHVSAMRAASAERMRMSGEISLQRAPIARGGWTWIGPGNVGVRVRAVVVHPTQTSTMFAGSVGAGTWKTTVGGAS